MSLLLTNYILTFRQLQILNGDLVRDTDILVEAPPRYRKTFSLLTFAWIVFFLCFFHLFTKRILLLILLTQTQQFGDGFFFLFVEQLYLSKTLYLRGKANQLAELTFNNSPINRLVALKCGSARDLMISVTLISVQQTTANACALRKLVDLARTKSTLQARWTHGSVTISSSRIGNKHFC